MRVPGVLRRNSYQHVRPGWETGDRSGRGPRAWDMGLRVVHGLVPAVGERAVPGSYEDEESVQQMVHPVEIGPRYGPCRLGCLPLTLINGDRPLLRTGPGYPRTGHHVRSAA